MNSVESSFQKYHVELLSNNSFLRCEAKNEGAFPLPNGSTHKMYHVTELKIFIHFSIANFQIRSNCLYCHELLPLL